MDADKRDVRSDFTDVDRATDPGHLVRFLNTVSALDVVRAYKRRSFELLGVRPGQVLLDLGCGNGDDARELAGLVGPTGRVVGVDRSAALIATARERLGGQPLPVEFRVGDGYRLDFPEATFDGCRADRVFHHLERPAQALAELVRVARPGARVVTIDPDFETGIVDAPDRALTRRLLNLNCDSYRDGWMGRHLPALFREAGLVEVAVEPLVVLFEEYTFANQVLALEGTVTRAQEAGVVSAAEGARWLADLQQASAAGRFFGSLTAFIVGGRKPFTG
jgi:ubiquinone/menaquinone biosynthesis C-methylase UbiE